jgi:2-methyl-3-hydroxypyridine 5-carboxylic acid dioxygenase
MPDPRRAEIAGAGFAGLTAAVALARHGWRVRIHESSTELRAFGAGIFIFENGLQVLKTLGAYEAALSGAYQPTIAQTRTNTGELLLERRYDRLDGTRVVTMTRQHLYQAMLSVVEKEHIEIVTGSKVVAADPNGVIRLSDGKRLEADLVVGADGVNSRVRDSLGLLKERLKFGYGIRRMLVTRTEEEERTPYWQNVMNFWSATRRILYCPCGKGALYLALGAHVSDQEAISVPIRKELWIETFTPLRQIIMRVPSTARYDEYETIKAVSWHLGKVAIVGDAAHGMPPSLGQGAGTAMMNALSLVTHLEAAGNVERGLADWERQERPLTEYTQDLASEYARTRRGSDGSDVLTAAALRAARHSPLGAEGVTEGP